MCTKMNFLFILFGAKKGAIISHWLLLNLYYQLIDETSEFILWIMSIIHPINLVFISFRRPSFSIPRFFESSFYFEKLRCYLNGKKYLELVQIASHNTYKRINNNNTKLAQKCRDITGIRQNPGSSCCDDPCLLEQTW